jgi:hypothetical protein
MIPAKVIVAMTAGPAVPHPPVVFRNNAMGAREFGILVPQATN